MFFIFLLFKIFVLSCSIVECGFFNTLERKVLAAIQRRRGPAVVGIFGLAQPFADGLKLFLKEIRPS